jgi:NAD(P)-dependent dehydrogenase (short-subunit alcohol dehydrogenase family)
MEASKKSSAIFSERVQSGRLGTPADIGKVAALLCSEDAGWITGQLLYADGGASLMNSEVAPEIQLG